MAWTSGRVRRACQRRGDRVQRVIDLRAQGTETDDGDNSDQGRNESVLNNGGAFFIATQLSQQCLDLLHFVPPKYDVSGLVPG